MTTQPTREALRDNDAKETVVVVAASVIDQQSGAMNVHKDINIPVIAPWENERHIKPPIGHEPFGDTESWASFVVQYGNPGATLLTWDEHGLRAVLDYHKSLTEPGRAQWIATMPFIYTPEWKAWEALTTGKAIGHRQVIEALEDRGEEIIDPPQGELMNLLRKLRVTMNGSSTSEVLEDGSVNVSFTKNAGVQAIGNVTLKPTFKIRIPVLKGSTKAYDLDVRVRPTPDAEQHLTIRLTIPAAENAKEKAYAEVIVLAVATLGEKYKLLRAAH